jgi:hypothetical protein
MDNSASDPNSGLPPLSTVPVVTDGLTRVGPQPHLARCVYFTIEANEPNSPWTLSAPNVIVPFLMLGLQGIVFRPVRPDREEFVSPDDWDDLVTTIEQIYGFSVDFEYFWIPVALLDRARLLSPASEESPNRLAARGEVYRIGPRLFTEAWRTARKGTDFQDYALRVLDGFDGDRLAAGLTYSPEETKSIQAWSITQVAGARIG